MHKQKLIHTSGSDMAEVNEHLEHGWKVVSISSCCTSCVADDGTPYFQSYCNVVIEL